MKKYVLKQHVKTKLKARGKPLVCSACGEPLKVGERVCHNSTFKYYYHKTCFDKTRI